MDYKSILFAQDRAVATITLNRPEKLNCFTREMHAELKHAVARLKTGGARCLVFTGAGRGFCAGQDLSERATTMAGGAPPDLGLTLGTLYNPLLLSLKALEMPVIAAVNGVATGAGANFALAADIVLAARSASFIQAFCKIGLVPDCGGTFFLPRLVGSARAMGLAMLGEPISAERAEQWGMIWKAVDDATLMEETQTLALRLAAAPTRGLALIKQAMNASQGNTLDVQLSLEAALQRQAGHTGDYREGVTAFLQKRAASFAGR